MLITTEEQVVMFVLAYLQVYSVYIKMPSQQLWLSMPMSYICMRNHLLDLIMLGMFVMFTMWLLSIVWMRNRPSGVRAEA